MWSATNSEGYEAPVAVATEAVIFALVDEGLAVLLTHRAHEPFITQWSLPGGFLGANESALECATRKLTEKTGIEAGYLEQLATYTEPGRDPRGWTPAIAYLALIPWQKPLTNEAAWHLVNDLPMMGFDHRDIVIDALRRLRGKLWYSNVAVGLLPEHFPLSLARRVYEAISGSSYDAANFRRDLLASGLIVSTGERQYLQRGRPALLYRFAATAPTWIPPKG